MLTKYLSLLRKRGEQATENMEDIGKYDEKLPGKWMVGHIIKELNISFQKRFLDCGSQAGLDEVTRMHGWIMGYLYHNQDREIYQKTIESEFNIQRSTVTAILQLMEKKGYIRREAVEGDARLKRIVLTDEGLDIAIRTRAMIDSMEKRLIDGIEEEKLQIFFEVAGKLRENMKNIKRKEDLNAENPSITDKRI